MMAFSRMAFGTGPRPISITFAQPGVAVVAWAPATSSSEYIFVPFGAPRAQLLPASTTLALDTAAGFLTCYAVASRTGTTVSGISDLVCGLSLAFGAGP